MIDLNHYIEIYITNECNLTCSNCNRFNNYDFREHYSWAESKAYIDAWSKRITAPMITIIGGEPSLHPELELWARGVASAWPNTPVCIQTNGIKNIKDFDWWESAVNNHSNLGVAVALHSDQFRKKFTQKFNPLQQFDAIMFSDCAIQPNGKSFTVYDSDPREAWQACSMKHSHTILNGLLYRCPVVGILPEFKKQYQVDLTQDQQSLLESYIPLTHECKDEDLIDFVNSVDSEMPQCRLCPEKCSLSVIQFDPKRKQYPRI